MLGLLLALGACDLKCDLCVMSTDEVGDGITQGFTDEQISGAISQVCASLPDPYSTYCSEYEANIVTIISNVRSGKASQVVCTEIGFCNEASSVNQYTDMIRSAIKNQVVKLSGRRPNTEKIRNLSTACSEFKGDAKLSCNQAALITGYGLTATYKGLRATNDEEESVCDSCRRVIKAIKALLDDHETEETIVAESAELCQSMPTSYAAICSQAIATYIPLILELLEEGVEALNICQNVGFCSTRAVTRIPKLENKKGIACDTCQFLYRWLEQQLETVTVAELWKLVSVECPKVEYIKYVCEMITEENVQTLVNMLIGQIEPKTACSVLSIC